MVKQRLVSSLQTLFLAVRVDIFDRHFQGEDIHNHRGVDLGVAAALLAGKNGSPSRSKEHCTEVREETVGVSVN